jgi:sulfite exporter TauE/SafE/plastocyanin
MNLWAIFFTGLTTGGLSCLAMQGGLLTSVIANQKEAALEGKEENTAARSFDQLDWLPVALFLGTKLVAHTLLGFLLGWLGSQVELSLSVRLLFQGVAALFMLATAANLLDLHPIFRYVVFQPPKFMQRLVRNSSKSSALFSPAVLGFMTIFIPCGVTQAMEVLAITSGSAFLGAAIMFAFVLGTSPIFAMVGVATAKLSETFTQRFLKIAAALLIVLALSSLNGILIVLDSPLSFGKVVRPVTELFAWNRFENQAPSNLPAVVNGVQRVTIQVVKNGYSPNYIQVKAGVPVELTLKTKDTYTCASSFILKAFNVRMRLGPTDSQTVTFTPTKKGKYPFSCSMGMYTGMLEAL